MTGEERHADDLRRVAADDAEYGREWTEQERMHLFPPAWPYSDLPLRLPNCPLCGFAMVAMTGGLIHPMAFCHNDECQVVTWDPTLSAVRTLEGIRSEDLG